MELYPLLQLAQGYLSAHYAQALVDRSKGAELRAYIVKYLYDTGYTVAGFTRESLTDRLYAEMAEYSVLTPWLKNPDIEEINVNGWDDIALTHLDGRIEKLTEHFFSPGHAVDVIKKLLHHSGMIIDSARPMSQGHLPGNTRITVLMDPIVDECCTRREWTEKVCSAPNPSRTKCCRSSKCACGSACPLSWRAEPRRARRPC